MPKALKSRRPAAARVYQTVDVQDLTGGLDLRRSASLLAPDRARVLRNASLAVPGELGIRLGYAAFSTINLGSTRVQGGQRVYLASTTFSVIAWGGQLYRPGDGGALGSSLTEGSTVASTAEVFFPSDRVLVAAFDGVNRPYKSTGDTTWTRMGIDASTGQSSASTPGASTGSLSASEFEFTFSYKDRGTGHESNISTRVSTITLAASTSVQLQTPNSSDAQVDAIVVYARNKTANETVLRKVSSGAASAGASSTFVIDSSAWSANAEAPTNHDVPLGYKWAVPWKNRWWAPSATIGNRLHFTELFQNQSWPTLFYVDIPFERGDEISATVPLGDVLVLFGQSKVFVIFGQTSLDFEVRPSAGAQAGALGARAVAALEEGIIHASAEGVFSYDGAVDRYLGHDIEPGWRDLIRRTPSTSLSLIALTHHFSYKELRVSVPRLYPRAEPGEWVLDLNQTREKGTPAWADTDRSIGGYMLWDGDEAVAGNRGRLVTWHSSVGRLFEESTGTSANSSNHTMEYEGPHLVTGLHRARFIDLHGEYEPHTGSLTAETLVVATGRGTLVIQEVQPAGKRRMRVREFLAGHPIQVGEQFG